MPTSSTSQRSAGSSVVATAGVRNLSAASTAAGFAIGLAAARGAVVAVAGGEALVSVLELAVAGAFSAACSDEVDVALTAARDAALTGEADVVLAKALGAPLSTASRATVCDSARGSPSRSSISLR